MLDLLISTAHAQAASPEQPNPIMSMAPLVIVFMIFYFLMLRPQKKRIEQEKQYINSLQKGDEVYTKSGLIGVIHGISDKVVTLEVEGDVKLKILKSHIAGPTKDIFAPKKNPA